MSWANVCAIPLFLVIVPGVYYYVNPYVHDKFLVTGLGISIAFCAYYVTRGIDKWLDQKRDNPEPFDVPANMDDAFADVLDMLENRHIGPYFWNIRFKDAEDMLIQGALNFSEQYHFLGHPPMMMQRQMMVKITFEEIDLPKKTEEEIEKEIQEKGYKPQEYRTKVKLQWYVDSPGNRVKCNEIIEDHTTEIKKTCGLHGLQEKEEPNIFMPPPWALIFLAGMVYFNFQRFEQVLEYKSKQAERQQHQENKHRSDATERQRQMDEANERRRRQQEKYDEDIRRYKENQRKLLENNNTYKPRIHDYNKPTNNNNSFAPVLTPQNQFNPGSLKINKPKKPTTQDPYFVPPK